jgi:diguanylate cyclase (GGDEF)-like protein
MDEGQQQEVSLPYTQPVHSIETLQFSTTIPDLQDSVLVIPRPSAHAIEVTINGEIVLKHSSIQSPTANIWNSMLTIPLQNLKDGDNQLEIVMSSASYDVGLLLPPYIDKEENLRYRVPFDIWLNNTFVYICIGASVIVGLILILFGRIQGKMLGAECYTGLTLLFASIFALDYTFRSSTGGMTTYLVVTKILMASGYLASLSFIFGLEKYFKDEIRIGKILAIPTAISVLVILAAPTQLFLLQSLMYLNVVLFILLMTAIVIMISKNKGNDWLVVPAVLLGLSLLQMILIMTFKRPWPYMLQYAVLISPLIFAVRLVERFGYLYRENAELQYQTCLDPLTGAFNRNILTKVNTCEKDTLVAMDIDNFKLYNDLYGHAAGDEVLVKFVKTIMLCLRWQDIVVRMGGDEFIMLLRDSKADNAPDVIGRINKKMDEDIQLRQIGFSYGIQQCVQPFNESIMVADESMYQMKREKGKDNDYKIID